MKGYCWHCGELLPEDVSFCIKCGADQNNFQTNGQNAQNMNKNSGDCKTVQGVKISNPYNETGAPGLISSTKLYFKDSCEVNKCMGRADYWWGILGMTLLNFAIRKYPLYFYFSNFFVGTRS